METGDINNLAGQYYAAVLEISVKQLKLRFACDALRQWCCVSN